MDNFWHDVKRMWRPVERVRQIGQRVIEDIWRPQVHAENLITAQQLREARLSEDYEPFFEKLMSLRAQKTIAEAAVVLLRMPDEERDEERTQELKDHVYALSNLPIFKIEHMGLPAPDMVLLGTHMGLPQCQTETS
jgi:hypothetical protein